METTAIENTNKKTDTIFYKKLNDKKRKFIWILSFLVIQTCKCSIKEIAIFIPRNYSNYFLSYTDFFICNKLNFSYVTNMKKKNSQISNTERKHGKLKMLLDNIWEYFFICNKHEEKNQKQPNIKYREKVYMMENIFVFLQMFSFVAFPLT